MPPKSVKLKDKNLWYSCDKCGIKLIQVNVKNHEKNCEKPENYVEDQKFYTNELSFTIPSEIELNEIPKTHFQKYVFVPESICNFTGLIMGCKVLIEFGGNKRYVRTLWTISDSFLDVVHTVSEGKML